DRAAAGNRACEALDRAVLAGRYEDRAVLDGEQAGAADPGSGRAVQQVDGDRAGAADAAAATERRGGALDRRGAAGGDAEAAADRVARAVGDEAGGSGAVEVVD